MDSLSVPSLAILFSAVLVLSCGQNHRITMADDRYTHATTVGISNETKHTQQNLMIFLYYLANTYSYIFLSLKSYLHLHFYFHN